MRETTYILRNLGPAALVLVDELGRGTSNRDGVALAWAVSERLLLHPRTMTLFATHYLQAHAVARTSEHALPSATACVTKRLRMGTFKHLARTSAPLISRVFAIATARSNAFHMPRRDISASVGCAKACICPPLAKLSQLANLKNLYSNVKTLSLSVEVRLASCTSHCALSASIDE